MTSRIDTAEAIELQAKMDHHAVRGAYAGFLSIEERDLFCLGDGLQKINLFVPALQDIIDSLDLFKQNISAHGASFLLQTLLGCPRQGGKGGRCGSMVHDAMPGRRKIRS